MKKSAFLQLITLCFSTGLFSQDPLLIDKQGAFQAIDWGVYTHYDCGFTKTETSAHYKNVLGFINTIRKNTPVVNELKGFDLTTRIYAEKCNAKFGYGIPAMINFEFAYWYLSKGQPVCFRIEPPSYKMYINQIRRFYDFGYAATYSYGDKTPAGFSKNAYEAAALKTQELFRTSGKKETLAPGIDRYNGLDIVVYNPDRPPYWLPVTVREAYKLIFDYYKNSPDQTDRDITLKMLEAEYAAFTEEELDGYAYSGGKGAFAQIGNDASSPQIMKVNPAYWNRNLPKSAIQFITFRLPPDQKYLEKKAEDCKKRNIAFYEIKFEAELDLYPFASLIDK